MLTKLGNEIEELTENFNKELESIINNQAELKNTTTEMKNIRRNQHRLSNREEQRSDPEDELVETNQSESRKKTRNHLRSLRDNSKCSNIHIAEIPDGEERRN